jgi:GNAT superfamily N-acetyltransferase
MCREKCPATLRPAAEDELELLREIHLSSRVLFTALGRTEVSAMPLIGETLLRQAVRDGGAIVAHGVQEVLGFGLCERIGRSSHLHQMSVRPRFTGRGVGSAILRCLLEGARGHGDECMTLITYADIAWNRPFYEHHGFSEIPPSRLPRHLSRLLADEQARGIDISRRTAMSQRLQEGEATP